MYDTIQRNSQIGNERRIVIDEVNTAQSWIVGIGAHGERIRASYFLQPPLLSVPAQGETWTVTQYVSEWRLDRKVEQQETRPATTLQEGDRRLEASGNIYIDGAEVHINGVILFSGVGSPEGVVTAPIGSIYTRSDGVPGATLYVKESGTDDTGWAAK